MLGAIDFEGGLENAWDSIITWVPKLLGFLLILGIGYFVAKAIEKVIDGILERVGFDRLVERGGLRTALSRSSWMPVRSLPGSSSMLSSCSSSSSRSGSSAPTRSAT